MPRDQAAVMYFPDLSNYSYLLGRHEFALVKNVGWLSEGTPFPRGPINAELVAMLKDLCTTDEAVVNKTRGYYQCPFCDQLVELNEGSQHKALGSAEIWAKSPRGDFFASPDLIIHYIETHRYAPPPEYLEAVRWTWSNRWHEGDQLLETLVQQLR